MSDQAGTASRRSYPVNAADLPVRAQGLLDDGFRLALVAAHEDDEAFRIVYLFTAGGPDRRVELMLRSDLGAPEVPSLATLSFCAGRFEREMHDLYGIVPVDHPLPQRLVQHRHCPDGWFPMRSDAGVPPPFAAPDEALPVRADEHPGGSELALGPIHGTLSEPGRFRFSLVGETIVQLRAQLWFTHKGIEKLAEGRSPEAALPLAERVAGDTTVGHTLAYCLAVEDAFNWEVPPQAGLLRAVLLELERLYNHVADLGALCNDAGHGIGNAQLLRIREQLLRINATAVSYTHLTLPTTPYV